MEIYVKPNLEKKLEKLKKVDGKEIKKYESVEKEKFQCESGKRRRRVKGLDQEEEIKKERKSK